MNGTGALAELLDLGISGVGLASAIVAGALLYAVARALRSRLRRLPLSKPRQALVARVRVLVEAAVVAIYVVWAVGRVLGGHPLSAAAVLVLLVVALLAVAWVPMRDVVAGLLLKASELCVPGDVIQVGDVKGLVRGLGARVIAIETADGGQAFVPYSRISREMLLRKPATDGIFAHAFELYLAPGAALRVADARDVVRRAALLSHWHSAVREPRVEPGEAGALAVTVFAIAPGQGHRVEADLRRALEAAGLLEPPGAAGSGRGGTASAERPS
jgi:small-conductance mechanosensitive channel